MGEPDLFLKFGIPNRTSGSTNCSNCMMNNMSGQLFYRLSHIFCNQQKANSLAGIEYLC